MALPSPRPAPTPPAEAEPQDSTGPWPALIDPSEPRGDYGDIGQAETERQLGVLLDARRADAQARARADAAARAAVQRQGGTRDCADCGLEIEPARLALLPATPRCASCAREHEARKAFASPRR